MVSVGPRGVRRDGNAPLRRVVWLSVAALVVLAGCSDGRREYMEIEVSPSGVGGAESGGTSPLGAAAGGGFQASSAGRGGALATGGASTGGNSNSGGSTTVEHAGGSGGVPSVGGAPVAGNAGVTSAGGSSAVLASATTSANLDTVEVGTTSPTTTWRIENRGTAATGVPTLTNATTEVLVVSNTCAAAIPAGQSCTIGFALRPAAGGSRTGKLTLSAMPGGTVSLSISGAGGHRLTVSLAGSTSGASISSTPAGINCGTTCTAVLAGPVKLTATTANGSGVFHTAWTGTAANCLAAPSRDCTLNMSQAHTVTARFSPLNNNLIFATSAAVSVTKGSAAAYDAECNAAATAAGINNAAGTDYVAVVSDNLSSVRTRLGSSARGWIRRDGLPFSDTQTGLFTSDVVLNPVRFDEFGNPSARNFTLTGTLATGAANPPACGNWTLDTADSIFGGGSVFGGPQSWVYSVSYTCNNTGAAVMCMGKSRTAQLTTTSTVGRRIWITTTVFVPGESTPDQKCQSERPAGVTSARALVATTSRTAASVLDMQATYVRPDGVVVGTGSQLAAGGELSSGIWQRADLGYTRVTGRFWTGQSTLLDLGTAATTCDNWTATTGTGNWSSGADTRNWWGQSNNLCTLNSQLRCVEAQ